MDPTTSSSSADPAAPQPLAATPANADAGAIVETMKTLTDIEADLAETALAVSSEPASDAQADAVMQSAESMEQTLEQSIPPPPAPATSAVEATETKEQERSVDTSADSTDATVPDAVAGAGADVISVPPEQVSTDANGSAEQAQQVIAAVQADIPVPILPAEVVEQAIEASTAPSAPAPVDNVNTERPAEQLANGDAITGLNAEASSSQPPVPPAVPANTATFDPTQPDGAAIEVDQTPAAPISQTPYEPHLEADSKLPEGLTPSSPSVAGNRDLVRSWQFDSTNEYTILSLFDWCIRRTEVNDARIWYGLLAEDNPTATQPLLSLINLELALSNFQQVEALFARALKGPSGEVTASADVSVWKAYLHYIRRQNSIVDGAPNLEQAQTTINQAYEIALKECGVDRESGEIWQEYLSFINDAPAKNTWDQQQKMDNLRKTYQKAVCIPLNNVEALWKAYDAFESASNKLTAKKFLAERSPAYMTARTALRELRQLTDSLPRPVLPPKPAYTAEDRRVISDWKAYLKWEEGNPLVIEDQSVLAGRVSYAMRKCLGEMRHFPECWHYASSYYTRTGRTDEAAEVLKAGVQACPHSVLLTFAYAEVEEERKNLAACHEAFDSLISHLVKEIEDMKVAVEGEINNARGPEIVAPPGQDVEMSGGGEIAKLIEEREARGKLVAERRGRDIADSQTALGVVWVMYLRFTRRAEGIKAARAIFGKARKSPLVTWHVYEASALMEYHTNKDSAVTIRIFELGFKHFADEVDYVIHYLQFLLSINDDANARALFERSATKITAERSRPLWDAWAKYEYQYGDLGAVQKLESRFAETFPNDSPLKRFAQRYIYNGIDEIAIRDLGFGRTRQPSAQMPLPPPTAMPPPTLPIPAPAPIAEPQLPKRPAPESPRGRNSVDRFSSPPRPGGAGGGDSNKRPRARSPPPPPRYRDPPPPRDGGRGSVGPPPRGGGGYGRNEREVSGPPRGGGIPPPAAAYVPPPAQNYLQYDRSGLTMPLARFIGSLPVASSFNGPLFRPDDIIGLFGNIDRSGAGMGGNRGGAGGYGAPPPPVRRY